MYREREREERGRYKEGETGRERGRQGEIEESKREMERDGERGTYTIQRQITNLYFL